MLVRKNNIVYIQNKDRWGRHLLFLADFEAMTIRFKNTRRKMYINDDDILCTAMYDQPLNETIQMFYNEWIEEHIDNVLLGELHD